MSIVERSAVQRPVASARRDDHEDALSVAVVGFGAIAQSKYLPALLKLSMSYHVSAVVNPSQPARDMARERFPHAKMFGEIPDDLAELGTIDAALLFTPPGVRPPLVERFLAHGIHVLSEKPLALTANVAAALAQRASECGRLLMVAHTRRFDPGYAALTESLDPAAVTTASAVTLETLWQPIVELAPIARPLNPVPEFERPPSAIDRSEISAALGTDDDRVLRYYRWVVSEALVHDIDLLADALGPATTVEACRFAERGAGLSALVRFGHVQTVLQWSLAPGLGEYEQTFQFAAPERRWTLRYPSPFLLNAPARLTVETAGFEPSGHASTTTVVSYEDAFVRLLRSFAARIGAGDLQPSSAIAATHSMRVAEALAVAELRSGAVPIASAETGIA